MLDIDLLRGWIGRSQSGSETIEPSPFGRLAATLDRTDPWPERGDPIPSSGHWLLFLPAYRQSQAGEDGHAARGEFLPPVPLPRRMWAGGRLVFHNPLLVGDAVTKTSRIKDVSAKFGRSGSLCFVLVEHRYETKRGLALVEEHDIVYREAPAKDAPPTRYEPAPESVWERSIVPDDLLLFRYSALTFNGHRIHYDRRYVTEVEGYRGLIVHGPLQATYLLDLIARQRPDARVKSFSFRALKPVFDIAPFTVCGKPDGDTVDLWIADNGGDLCMSAQATLASPN
ncbi:MAG: MaoC family dehydratase N-terminal domain-containing protein [Beijerinckiaceae bacterium]